MTHLQQSWSKHWHEETLVEKVEQLVSDHRVSHLHHCIAELQRVHEERQCGHLVDVISGDAEPIDGRDLDGVR